MAEADEILYGETPAREATESERKLNELEQRLGALGELGEWEPQARSVECGLAVAEIISIVRDLTIERAEEMFILRSYREKQVISSVKARATAFTGARGDLGQCARRAIIAAANKDYLAESAEYDEVVVSAADGAVALISKAELDKDYFNSLYQPWEAMQK